MIVIIMKQNYNNHNLSKRNWIERINNINNNLVR